MKSFTDTLDTFLVKLQYLGNDQMKAYSKKYGKDATLYRINSTEGVNTMERQYDSTSDDPIIEMANEYVTAFGRDKVGYDYAKMQSVPIKVFYDANTYNKNYLGADVQTNMYVYNDNDIAICVGDVLSFSILDKQVFYKVITDPESYYGCLLRLQLKLIETKKVESKVKINNDISDEEKEGILL